MIFWTIVIVALILYWKISIVFTNLRLRMELSQRELLYSNGVIMHELLEIHKTLGTVVYGVTPEGTSFTFEVSESV